MVFFCYKCHKTIYNGSPAYHNQYCRVPFRNRNNNNQIRNRFNHNRFNNDYNYRSNQFNYNRRFNNNNNYHDNRYNYNRYPNNNNNYRNNLNYNSFRRYSPINSNRIHERNNRNNDLGEMNNLSNFNINRNVERIRFNHNYNRNNSNNEINNFLRNQILELLIDRILLNSNDRDNYNIEINHNNDNDDFDSLEDSSESSDENALDEDVINTYPKTIIDNIEKLKEKNCSICLEDFKKGEEQMTIPCFHIFHSKCISHWFKLNNCCPICKYECK